MVTLAGDRPAGRVPAHEPPAAARLPLGAATRSTARSAACSRSRPALVAFAHGCNDAQKTMGVITLALITSGHLPTTAPIPTLGDPRRRPVHGARHVLRRLAHHPHAGQQGHPARPHPRLRRRDQLGRRSSSRPRTSASRSRRPRRSPPRSWAPARPAASRPSSGASPATSSGPGSSRIPAAGLVAAGAYFLITSSTRRARHASVSATAKSLDGTGATITPA